MPIEKISDNNLIAELRETGAWEVSELTSRVENEYKILWISCCDIADNIKHS